MSGRRTLTLMVIMIGSCAAGACKDLALVSNKANTVTEVTLPELVRISKGQTERWPDGMPVTFVTRSPVSPDMKIALDKIYGVGREEAANIIANSNRNRMKRPLIVIVDSDEMVLKKVLITRGAIGLVDVYSITGAVNVMRIGGKLPLEPGYTLHGK